MDSNFPSPTSEDYHAAWHFVEELPKEKHADNLTDNLAPVWERYNLSQSEMSHLVHEVSHYVCQQFNDYLSYKKGTGGSDKFAEWSESPSRLLETMIGGALIQMAAFGAEFTRRWVLPQMVEEAIQLQGEIDRLTNGE